MRLNYSIKKLRESRGLSQETLAQHLEVSRGTYANYEQGRREPDYQTICKIADFYNVPMDLLFERQDINYSTSIPSNFKSELHETVAKAISKLDEHELLLVKEFLAKLKKYN